MKILSKSLVFNFLVVVSFIQVAKVNDVFGYDLGDYDEGYTVHVFPYHHHIQLAKKEKSALDEKAGIEDEACIIEVYQKGKLVSSDENWRCSILVNEKDINGDGIKDVVYLMNGMSRASYYLGFFSIEPHVKVEHYDLSVNDFEFKDFGGDGRYYLKTWVDLDLIFDTRFNRFPIFVEWEGNAFKINFSLTELENKKLLQLAFPEDFKIYFGVESFGLVVDFDRVPKNTYDYVHNFIDKIILLFMLGKKQEALQLVKKYCIFDNDAQQLLFFQEVVDEISSSLKQDMWHQVAVKNHWYTEGMMGPKYCDGRIGGNLFMVFNEEKDKWCSYYPIDRKSVIVMDLYNEFEKIKK